MSSKKVTVVAALLLVSIVAYLLACSQAVWSPDGKSLAFVTKVGDDKYQLYVADGSGDKAPRLLWTSPTYLSAPGWSADGKKLLVINTTQIDMKADEAAKLPVAVESKDPKVPLADRLYVVEVGDGSQKLLAEQKFQGGSDLTTGERGVIEPQPQWTKDGKQIIWPVQELRQVRILSAEDGKLAKQFDKVAASALSPSGKLLATIDSAEGPEKPCEIAVIDLQKLESRSLLKAQASATSFGVASAPAWMADESKLLVAGRLLEKAADSAGSPSAKPGSGLWTVALADGKCEQVLKDFPHEIFWVACAPKGNLLAFSATLEKGKDEKESPPGKSGVWLVKPDGSGLKRIDRAKGEDMAYDPTFSPDGSKLSYRLIVKDVEIMNVVVYDLASGVEKMVPLKAPEKPKPAEEQPATSEAKPPAK